jgi:hypothetical protein
VTRIPIAKQRLSKHIPAEANAHNNKTSIAKQRISKHAFLAVEAVFYAWSVQSAYKDVFSSCCQELGPFVEMTVQGNWEEMARKESDGVKKTSCVVWSYSETVINPLLGYD